MTPINIRTRADCAARSRSLITAAIGPAVIRYLRKMKFGQKILGDRPEVAYEQAEHPDDGRVYVHHRHRGGGRTRRACHRLAGRGFGLTRWRCWALPRRTARSVWWTTTRRSSKKENAGPTPEAEAGASDSGGGRRSSWCCSWGSDGLPAAHGSRLRTCGDPACRGRCTSSFAAFVIVGADNAVNLTDGLDGLAAGVTAAGRGVLRGGRRCASAGRGRDRCSRRRSGGRPARRS